MDSHCLKIYVFRPEIASALTGLPLGETVTSESVAVLVTHEQGLTKGSPAQARIVPFINKVDTEVLLQKAIQLSRKNIGFTAP